METECPYCRAPLELLENLSWQTCGQCHQRLHVQTQLVYARARATFAAGQDALSAVAGSRDKDTIRSLEAKGILAYQQALSGLEVAFGPHLTEEQRQTGIEMMMEISRVLSGKGMVSAVFASYWFTLLVEQNARRERDELNRKLSGPTHRGLLGLPVRWHWHLRRSQLTRALARLDRQIRQLEEVIAFAEPPRARLVKP